MKSITGRHEVSATSGLIGQTEVVTLRRCPKTVIVKLGVLGSILGGTQHKDDKEKDLVLRLSPI